MPSLYLLIKELNNNGSEVIDIIKIYSPNTIKQKVMGNPTASNRSWIATAQ
jgi:hypothetical protein